MATDPFEAELLALLAETRADAAAAHEKEASNKRKRNPFLCHEEVTADDVQSISSFVAGGRGG